MTDFISVSDYKNTKEGSFIGVVIKASEVASGDSNGRKWKKRVFTVEDATANIEITAWNEKVDGLTIGDKCEFLNLGQKPYNGKIFFNLGKETIITKIDTIEIPEPKKLKNSGNDMIDTGHLQIFVDEYIQVRGSIITRVKEYESDPNPAMIGQMTEMYMRKNLA